MSTPKTNPVQIVLNSSNYIDAQEILAGGGAKDFFGGKDAAFAAHKAKVTQQLSSIQGTLATSSGCRVAFVKVKLRKEAVAKSHRPTSKIFRPDLCPMVGADDIGEIYYRVTGPGLARALGAVTKAEPESRPQQKKNSDDIEYKPSKERSEVGAILDITLPEEADRRSFSIDEGIRWLNDERSGRLYVVSFFQLPMNQGELLSLPQEELSAFENFLDCLNSLPFGVQIFRSSVSKGESFEFLFLRPVRCKSLLTLESLFTTWSEKMDDDDYDPTPEHHAQLIKLLSSHPVVRRISLPPIITSATPSGALVSSRKALFPDRSQSRRYPRVGVIDGGIDSSFDDWRVGKVDLIADHDRNESHGSFIAGLLVGARAAGNPSSVAVEEDGCDIFDIDIFPNQHIAGAFQRYFKNGFEDFLQEVEMGVSRAKREAGVRVFNLSLNVTQQVDDSSYGALASMLDAIAERHDVVIVVSAGNLPPGGFRGAWPSDATKVPSYLLPYASRDRIFVPAESVYALSVGSVNPPGITGQIPGAPSPFTRRGPGMKVGVKPDFCHYGGTAPVVSGEDEGLYSAHPDGSVYAGCGTSFAAPLVAKTMATVDDMISGHVQRETLIGLMVHSAKRPAPLQGEELNTIAKNFVGFGLPGSAEDVLLNDDHSITMVFHSVLAPRKELVFNFAWPKALTSPTGKCRGEARMTLVYKPVVDASCGSEFIRVNLDAYLRQSDGNGKFASGKTTQAFVSGSKKDPHFEADLIEHGLKWWPTKHYRMVMPKGRGKSSSWRLVVDSLARGGGCFPPSGIPFSVILTISDDRREQAIFQDMRQWLSANSVKIDDIRTASRIRPQAS